MEIWGNAVLSHPTPNISADAMASAGLERSAICSAVDKLKRSMD